MTMNAACRPTSGLCCPMPSSMAREMTQAPAEETGADGSGKDGLTDNLQVPGEFGAQGIRHGSGQGASDPPAHAPSRSHNGQMRARNYSVLPLSGHAVSPAEGIRAMYGTGQITSQMHSYSAGRTSSCHHLSSRSSRRSSKTSAMSSARMTSVELPPKDTDRLTTFDRSPFMISAALPVSVSL